MVFFIPLEDTITTVAKIYLIKFLFLDIGKDIDKKSNLPQVDVWTGITIKQLGKKNINFILVQKNLKSYFLLFKVLSFFVCSEGCR